jgi:hypothetical protein
MISVMMALVMALVMALMMMIMGRLGGRMRTTSMMTWREGGWRGWVRWAGVGESLLLFHPRMMVGMRSASEEVGKEAEVWAGVVEAVTEAVKGREMRLEWGLGWMCCWIKCND